MAVKYFFQERLDYEIHVLRKHEEEVILVKSEQKRKVGFYGLKSW